MTLSEENYLKAIFHLEKDFAGGISTNAIAEKMETKASSVTDMVKRLAEKGFVAHVPYQGVHLTQKGKNVAVGVIRKHRLWEVFLVDKLNFKWDEVHDVAEQLEHIKSEKLIDQLDDFLGNPISDPHGDPIPDREGNMFTAHDVLLSDINRDEKCVCVGVKDSSSEFLKYLDKHEIALGRKIRVLEKESFDQSLRIRIKKKELVISHQIATNLYVKRL